MPFTAEDNETMGRIADATLAKDVGELIQMLTDQDFIKRLMVSENYEPDPDFKDRLEQMIITLEFLLEVARDRL